MTTARRALFLAPCLLALASAQTMIEYSLGAARAAAGAAAMSGVGKSVGGIFGKLNSTLNQSAKPATVTSVASPTTAKPDNASSTAAPAPDEPKPSPVCADDPAKVTAGLLYEELLARCGVPALKTLTGADGLQLLFSSSKKETVVTVAAGKVAAVASHQKATDGVVVLQ